MLGPERSAALAAWRRHCARGAFDTRAAIEAAAVATVVETDAGPRFEPDGFGELVAFIADLPF